MTQEQQLQFNRYEKGDFTKEQLAEIRQGIEGGKDVTVYARKGIPASEMAFIRKYLNVPKETLPTKENGEEEDDYELIERQFVSYRQTIQLSVFEKIVTYAITISGIAIIAALYTMLMCWPRQ